MCSQQFMLECKNCFLKPLLPKGGPRAFSITSSGSLVKIQNLRHHLRPTESESAFENQSCPRCLAWRLKFKKRLKHYSIIFFKLPLLNSVLPLSLQWWLASMEVYTGRTFKWVIWSGSSLLRHLDQWTTYSCLVQEKYNHKINENMVFSYNATFWHGTMAK